ncbi:hypothetical protein INT47_005256 [Mucor saturninus]|uniref:Ty3 transposon capsid-like protein domain-containing protein n=1 Tax=Mucor saturninus TaxID=64648 RepID=A0A8H7R6B6_9FUNG|nr:hypothetical protein INT47_005256 [Mucor saturninus]
MTNLTDEQIQALDNMIQRQNEILEINRTLEQRLVSMDQQYRQQLTELDTKIYEYIATNVVLKSDHPQPQTHQTNNVPLRLKPPTPFSGKSSYCDSFFISLSLIFAGDEIRFDTDRKKILYAINCLTGHAFSFMEPYLKDIDNVDAPHEILTNYAHFKHVMRSTFGDINPIVNAESDLRALKQTGAAAIYATEFRRISMQLSWNNEALISQYLLNLKDNIKDELARREPITDLTILLNASIDIDNRLFQRQKQKNYDNNNRSNNYHNKPTTSYSRPDPNVTSTSTPMEISNINESRPSKYRPLTQAEKDRRVKYKLCMYCGGDDHFTNSCPVKPHRNNHPTISTILVDNHNQPMSPNSITAVHNINHINNTKKRKPNNQLMQVYKESVNHKRASIDRCIADDILYVAESLDENLLVIPITIKLDNILFTTTALIDSGASASFIDASLVRKTGLLSQPSSEAITFRLANNSIQSSAMSSTVFMQIAGTHHEEFITLRHLEPSAHPVILGMNWLKRHNPAFHHRDNLMVITCLFRDCTPTSVISASKIPIVHPYDNDLIAPCAAAIIEPPVSTNPDRQQTIYNLIILPHPRSSLPS